MESAGDLVYELRVDGLKGGLEGKRLEEVDGLAHVSLADGEHDFLGGLIHLQVLLLQYVSETLLGVFVLDRVEFEARASGLQGGDYLADVVAN